MYDKSITLRSPESEEHKISIPAEVADLTSAYNGYVGSLSGDTYEINRNIIELLGADVGPTTLAQSTNFWGLTASVYEENWRKRSISSLSGETFTLDDEATLLIEWMSPKAGLKYIDLGCSTAFYARQITKAQPEASVIALDFSIPMLREARKKCKEDKCDIFLLQANAESLPFFAGSVDGVVCGGTLNEFRDPVKALYETRRVLKKGSTSFFMYLLKSDHLIGSVIQKTTQIGGISFWSEAESYNLFERCGFQIKNQKRLGIVNFVLIEAV